MQRASALPRALLRGVLPLTAVAAAAALLDEGGGPPASAPGGGAGRGGGGDGVVAADDSAAGEPRESDPLLAAGASAEARRAALAAAARTSGRSELEELLDAIARCVACPARSDLASMLAGWDASVLATPEVMERLVRIAGSDAPEPVRIAAVRAINAVPEAQRPESARRFDARRVEIVCVPGQMRWEPREFSVPAGAVVEIRMRNDDSMQHNLLVVAPGALSEIGVAADRMGETAEGKARQFVPDSPKVLHVMGLVDPAETGTLWFFAPSRPATYPLVCTYPGHWRMMNGRMRVTKPAD